MEPTDTTPPPDPHDVHDDQDEHLIPTAVPGQFITPHAGSAPTISSEPEPSPLPESSPSTGFTHFSPLSGAAPESPVANDAAPAPVSTGLSPITSPTPFRNPKRKRKLVPTLLMVGAIIVILGGGAAAYYFGYYMNANVIWSQSLGNTNKGYDKLIQYLNTQSKAHSKSVDENGNFTVQVGSAHYDGTMTTQSEGENTNSTFKINAGTTQVDAQLRSVSVRGATAPDVYLNLRGITGLGDVFGSTFGKAVNSLNGKWIAVNHTFLEDIESEDPQLNTKDKAPSEAEVAAAAKAIGTVNAKYVLTTNKQYAVTKVVQKYGMVTIGGQKMYHYKVGFVKQNVKAYVTALRNALQQTQLGKWAVSETGESMNKLIGYNDDEASANKIKSSDTIGVWVNMKTRIIYKVRVSEQQNPAENYVDVGLNYDGGNTFPFFMNIEGMDNGVEAGADLTATINTKTNAVSLNVAYDDPQKNSPETATLSLNIQSSNKAVTVQVPTGAESISTVLDKLGLGTLVSGMLDTSGSSVSPPASTTSLLGSSL